MENKSVELGFVEKRATWRLRSKFFASKVGGFPSWLNLNKLPTSSELKCKICGKPCLFLLQVYAPVPEIEDAFHRTIFIFICRNGDCSKKFSNENFKIYRSQLPLKNEFYSSDPPVEEERSSLTPNANEYQPLCEVCGCLSEIKCEKCVKKNYCSVEHRDYDWTRCHKDMCVEEAKGAGAKKNKKLKNEFLLPEFEILTETEELPTEAPEKSEKVKMQEYQQFMDSENAPKLQTESFDELCEFIEKKNDKAFNKFQKRVKIDPEQVIRYQRGGEPLWVSSENIPSCKDIPPCVCGAKRTFEFQVMPQLLNYLLLETAVNSVDWGTLLIYTCSKSCKEGNNGYVKEFLWKQDFTDC